MAPPTAPLTSQSAASGSLALASPQIGPLLQCHEVVILPHSCSPFLRHAGVLSRVKKETLLLYLVWPVGPDAIRREGQNKWVETTRLHSLHKPMHCGRYQFDQPLAVCTRSAWDLLISGKAISRKPNDIVYLFV